MKKLLLSGLLLLSASSAFSWYCESYSSYAPGCNGWATHPVYGVAANMAVSNCRACTPVGWFCSPASCN